jgi:hypothetical protein
VQQTQAEGRKPVFPRFSRIELYSRKSVARYWRFFGATLDSKSFLPLKNLVA